MTYKVLSLTQPWALLLVLGIKKVETRSWGIRPTENLLIHASANMNKAAKEFMNSPWYVENVMPLIEGQYHFGAIIGAVDVIGCGKAIPNGVASEPSTCAAVQNCIWDKTQQWFVSYFADEFEFKLGDYTSSDRRQGWVCENPRILDKPIPAKGQLRIWTFETDEPLEFIKPDSHA